MLGFALRPTSLLAQAPDPNACDAPGDSPNVIVGDLYELQRWGKVGDITAFSVGTFSCNIGSCWLDWITGNGDNRHPTIGQNLVRLKDGRLEHVGQSWLKHGFYALSERLCSPDCLDTDGEHLGVNCSDPYSSDLNGEQTRLGPKFEVNATTGVHPHPVSMQNRTGDEIFKRLQVHDRDLDPALNPGARYFLEGQYVAADDAAAGNQHDNASYREVSVVDGGGGFFDLAFAADTQRMRPAILAWSDNDPGVVLASVDDSDGGRFWLAAKATDLGGGTWHYEYAVQNLDSDRSAGSYAVPVPTGIVTSNVSFHDVDYHSGEPFDGTDWSKSDGTDDSITWSTLPYATDPNANALRWGTIYNFRFDADAPPVDTLVTIGLFKPGAPGSQRSLVVPLIGPNGCNGNGTCDAGETCVACPNECGGGAPDNDGDGLGYCSDCNDNDVANWGPSGEVLMLLATRGPAGEVLMIWREPFDPGTRDPRYEVLRSTTPSDFTSPTCLRGPDPHSRSLVDAGAPAGGRFLSYLARGRSHCAMGVGTTGTDSFGRERLAADCP
jgi:hypothetical protein